MHPCPCRASSAGRRLGSPFHTSEGSGSSHVPRTDGQDRARDSWKSFLLSRKHGDLDVFASVDRVCIGRDLSLLVGTARSAGAQMGGRTPERKKAIFSASLKQKNRLLGYFCSIGFYSGWASCVLYAGQMKHFPENLQTRFPKRRRAISVKSVNRIEVMGEFICTLIRPRKKIFSLLHQMKASTKEALYLVGNVLSTRPT